MLTWSFDTQKINVVFFFLFALHEAQRLLARRKNSVHIVCDVIIRPSRLDLGRYRRAQQLLL